MNARHASGRPQAGWLGRLGGLILATCLLIVACTPGVASASIPQSFTEAAEQGDPAASAPVIQTPEIYILEGKRISAEEVLAKELVCLQTDVNYLCDTNEAQMEARALRKAERRGTAKASMQCGGGISLMYMNQWPNYGGAVTTLEKMNAWYDLGQTLNNNTSSFKIGEANGHLSEDTGGFGFWYPGNTSECALQPDLNGTGWNNRISSRYRYK